MNFVSLLAQTPQYNYSQDISAADSAAAAGSVLLMVLFLLIVTVAAYVLTALLLARIFKKAGVESWKAWVPIYNNWVLLELGGQKGYWAALALIPFVNIISAVFMWIAMYRIGLGFGKEGVFVLLAIFIPLVWYIWLAFDSSTWKGPRIPSSEPLYTKNDSDTSPSSTAK